MNERKDDQKMKQQMPQGGQGDGQQQQQQGGAGQQYGEGSYSGTKQYNDGLKKHMNQHDVEKEALDAKPRSEEEARQMEEAERIGKSRSKGEDSGMPGTKSGGKD